MDKKRKRGPQPGNKNSKDPGLYGTSLDKTERALLKKASGIEGLDEEIAMLRLKLQQILTKYPERIDLTLQTADTLAKLVRTRYQISKEQKNALKNAIEKVVTEIAVPLAIKFLIK
jgi:hypothetical protein